MKGNICVIQWDGISERAHLLRTAIDIETNQRLNDAKADPRGRLFCGIFPAKAIIDIFFNTMQGTLYRYARDEKKIALEKNLCLPNGLTWNEKTQKFYCIDTLAYDVKEYDYDIQTGDICKCYDFYT